MNKILQTITVIGLVLTVLWGSVGINVAHVCHEHCTTVQAEVHEHSKACETSVCENGFSHEELVKDPHPHHCGCGDIPEGTLLKIDFESLLAINTIFTMLPKELKTLLNVSTNSLPQTYVADNVSKDPSFKGRDILVLKSVLII